MNTNERCLLRFLADPTRLDLSLEKLKESILKKEEKLEHEKYKSNPIKTSN